MSTMWKEGITVVDWKAKVKTFFTDTWNSFFVQFEGMYEGEHYQNKFYASDMEYRFSNELTTSIDTITDTFELDSPLCIIYTKDATKGKRAPTTGSLVAEFQIVVNTKPQAILNLNGYTMLIKALCDPEKGAAYWAGFNLTPRLVEEGATLNGGKLLEKLQDRLFIRSVIVTFDILGDYING